LGNSKILLGSNEDVIPQPCLQISLQLGNVEVGTGTVADKVVHVVIKVQPKVEEGSRGNLAVNGNVRLVKMPSTRTNEEDGSLLLGSVDLASLGIGVSNGTADGIAEVALSFGQVAPRGRRGVLKVGHVDVGAAVETVDYHLTIDGAGDFDASILQIGRNGSALPRWAVVVRLRLPTAVGELAIVSNKVRLTTGIKFHGAGGTGGEEGTATILELVA